MRKQTSTTLDCGPRALDTQALHAVSGGIWDYSNRLGMLGQMLEDRQDRNYGNPFGPKTLDEAAHQALEGWISVP